MVFASHSLSPSELSTLLAAERQGSPFLSYQDALGEMRLMPLVACHEATIGRGGDNDLALDWDPEVSRTHAQLELVAGAWTLVDDGLSRNGSFVNGERVLGRRRLRDGDTLRVGRTSVHFHAPGSGGQSTIAADAAALVRLSAAERRVLVALCRPLLAPGGIAVPASNREIAEELQLSVDGVKTHVRALFAKLEVEDLPQFRKRAELARRALDIGAVSARDLRP